MVCCQYSPVAANRNATMVDPLIVTSRISLSASAVSQGSLLGKQKLDECHFAALEFVSHRFDLVLASACRD